MEMLRLASEFARVIQPFMNDLALKDIVLYGSVVRALQGRLRRQPKDADVIIIHRGNEILQRYEETLQWDKNASDYTKWIWLCTALEEAGHRLSLIDTNETVLQGITAGKLNLHFLDALFFTDKAHEDRMRDLNPDHLFYERVFSHALLYNPQTGEFDTPIREKYLFPTRPN